MQTYPLALAASNNFATIIQNEGSYFLFESGSSTGNSSIKVKTDVGDDLEVKPGQGVTLTKKVTKWFISSLDGSSVINGKIVIGEGTFTDNNGTIIGAVSAAITNQPTVNLAVGSKVQEELIAFNGSWVSTAIAAGFTATQIVAPAANVNGIIVNRSLIQYDQFGGGMSFVSKAGAAPVNFMDGDCLQIIAAQPNATLWEKTDKIKVPPGRGIYFCSKGENGGFLKSIIYTIL